MIIKDFLNSLTGPKIVSLRTKTQVKLLVASKTLWPLGVTKISVRNGIIGASYENAVNNSLAKNYIPPAHDERNPDANMDMSDLPHFDAGTLWHGKGRSITRFLCEHIESGKEYLKFLPSATNKPKNTFVDNVDGKEISPDEIKKYEGKKTFNAIVSWQVIELSNVVGVNNIDFTYF